MKNKRRVRAVSGSGLKGLTLNRITPYTEMQEKFLAAEKNVVAHGYAGTGKTFLATYLALLGIESRMYDHLMYIRSAVPTRNMGFLPGTEKEKSEAYETPYKKIALDLFNDVNAYDKLKNDGKVRFTTTSFLRGSTLDDCCIIVDECQNMNLHELDSIITRMGENSRAFFCGDKCQDGDLGNEKSGLVPFMNILKRIPQHFEFIEFGLEDVVRSGLVKDYLYAKYG